MITFNVSTYGVVFGSGQTEIVQRANTQAVRACCNAAVAASTGDDVEVVIDQAGGIVECYLDPTTDMLPRDAGGSITMIASLKPDPAHRLTVRGANQASAISFFPDGPTFDYALMYIDAFSALRQVTFSNFTWNGPPSFGSDDPTLDFTRTPMQHQGTTTPGSFPQSTIICQDVVTTGSFYGSFNSNAGDITLNLIDNNFTSVMLAINIFNQNECTKALNVTGGFYTSTFDTEDQGVCFYIHPNIQTHINGVDLTCPTRYCVYFNGNPDVPVPDGALVENCTAHGGDFVQSNVLTLTTIRNNTSTTSVTEGAQCIAIGPTDIHDNIFFGGQIEAITGPHGDGAHSLQHVHNNTYNGVASGISGFVKAANCYVHDNIVIGDDLQFAVVASAVALAGNVCRVENNTVSGTYKGLIATDDDHGKVIVRNNTLTGSGRLVYGIGEGGAELFSLYLENNNAPDQAILLDSFVNHVVSGDGNILRYPGPIDLTVGTVSVQDIRNREAASGTPVASASTVAVDCNFNHVHVTGVATIDTLVISDADQNGYFRGHYTLVFDAASRTSVDGNILPVTTTARVPGSTGNFYWRTDLGKWQEVAPGGTISPSDNVVFLRTSNDSGEIFELGDGAKDGHKLTISVNEGSGTVVVEIFHLSISGASGTLQSDPSLACGVVLIWNAEAGYWNIIAATGFTVS